MVSLTVDMVVMSVEKEKGLYIGCGNGDGVEIRDG